MGNFLWIHSTLTTNYIIKQLQPKSFLQDIVFIQIYFTWVLHKISTHYTFNQGMFPQPWSWPWCWPSMGEFTHYTDYYLCLFSIIQYFPFTMIKIFFLIVISNLLSVVCALMFDCTYILNWWSAFLNTVNNWMNFLNIMSTMKFIFV